MGSSDGGLVAGASSAGDEILILLHATVAKVTRHRTAGGQQEKPLCVLVLGQSKNCSPLCPPPHLPGQGGAGAEQQGCWLRIRDVSSGSTQATACWYGAHQEANGHRSKKKFAGFGSF